MNKEELLFIINAYGTRSQEDVAIEEMAELQKAILKHRRNADNLTRAEIVDEIADVEIMLEQLKIIYSCRKEVEERKAYKIGRQIGRILKKYNIKKEKGCVWDNYECEGQLNITDFPEAIP